MDQEPITTEKDEKENQEISDASKVCSISIRGFITLIIVITVCTMSLIKIEVKEPMYTLVGLTIGYYFGHSVHEKKK